MKERGSPRNSAEASRPPYERVSRGLTQLLATAGVTVMEGFPPFARRFARHGAMTDYDDATRSLVVHPWISPRAKIEALLHQTVMTLTDKQPKQRGRKAEETRRWAVEAVVARHYGLPVDEIYRSDIELTISERSLVERIVGSIEHDPAP